MVVFPVEMESSQPSRFQAVYNGRNSPYLGHEQSCPLIIPGPVHVCAGCQEIHETVSRTRCFSNFTSQCEILIFEFTNNLHFYEKLDPTLRGRAKQHSLELSRRILSNQTHKLVCIYSSLLTFTSHCLDAYSALQT